MKKLITGEETYSNINVVLQKRIAWTEHVLWKMETKGALRIRKTDKISKALNEEKGLTRI